MNIVFMSMDTLPSTLWARDLYDQMSALTKIKQDTFLSKFILISNPSRRWNRSLPDLSRRDGSLNNTI